MKVLVLVAGLGLGLVFLFIMASSIYGTPKESKDTQIHIVRR